ncbi:MAG: hypothetical protein LC772_02080 [Chloroflexi bacterium]|nr:hypothetical protein [Chloroflexota bacterium]
MSRFSQALLVGMALSAAVSAGCGGGGGSTPTLTAIPLVPGVTIGRVVFPNGSTSQGGQGSPVAGIPCGNEVLNYHIHAHVSLFVNGQQDAIPAQIGITSACLYYLHTHDASGIVHVEATQPQTFTLGQFFQIWGEPLSTTDVAGFTGPVTVYVNGVPYTGDPNAVTLAAHEEITLEGGTIVAPPTYSWPADY